MADIPHRHRHGFTLIEVLIVLLIILVLASLMTVGLARIEDQRNRLLTVQRVETVLNTMARLGISGSGSVTYELQSRIEGFGGTRRFERGLGVSAAPYVLPEDSNGDGTADPWHAVFPAAGAVAPDNPVVAHSGEFGSPLIMAYPWGNERRYRIGDWNNPGDADYYYWELYESQVSGDPTYAYPAAERHIIRELWPQRSGDILALLGIASDAETYASNRNPKQGWNDAWGHPLVVAYALYQPPQYQGSDARRYPDSYLQRARQEYQYNRSVFVSVGAPGPDISPYTLDVAWNVAMIGMWNHICDIAMPNDNYLWDEQSFNINPWSGIHSLKDPDSKRITYISAPVEFR